MLRCRDIGPYLPSAHMLKPLTLRLKRHALNFTPAHHWDPRHRGPMHTTSRTAFTFASMRGITSALIGLTWRHLVAAVVVYIASLVFYRLYLGPLAHFPGPKLAAVTRYVEAYHDIIRNGQYTFEIAKMHKIYGGLDPPSPLPGSSSC